MSKNFDKFKSLHLVIDFIDNNYSKNYSVQYYAKMCNLDKYYFIKLFKECTGDSPHLYRTKKRIEKARELLKNTQLNNSEIAEAIGYHNSYYFSRIFKTHTGISPDQFRKQI